MGPGNGYWSKKAGYDFRPPHLKPVVARPGEDPRLFPKTGALYWSGRSALIAADCMRTLPELSAAVPRSLLSVVICSLCLPICAPLARAKGPANYAATAPVPYFSPLAFGQQSSPPQTISLNSPKPVDIDSI